MTKQEQDIFFSVIRASIWQKEIDVEIPVGFQWQTLIQAYADHALLGVVADKMLSLPEDRRPTKEQKRYIMWYVASNIKTHNQLNIALVDAFRKLEAAGCHPVLLKGQGLATLYPNPMMRGCGDIDIYVGEEEFEKACSLINGICGVKDEEVDIYARDLHYEVHNGDIAFEVHKKAAEASIGSKYEKFNAWAKNWLQQEKNAKVIINGEEIPVPAPQYNLLFIFDHLSKHYLYEGVGLRQFIDWALLLHFSSEKVDIDLLHHDLKTYSSLYAWQGFGGILCKQLGMPVNDFPLYDEKVAVKSQGIVLGNIIRLANFGVNNDEIVHYFAMEHSFRNDWKRFKFIIKQYNQERVLYPKESISRFLYRLHCELGLIKRHFLS